MRRWIALAVFAIFIAGCAREGLRQSQACISEHAAAIRTEVERLAPVIEDREPREGIDRILQSANRVGEWTELTQSHVGRASDPPEILTQDEVRAQGVYKQDIAREQMLKRWAANKLAGGGGGIWGTLLTWATGGGLVSLVGALGLRERKRRKVAEEKANGGKKPKGGRK